MSEMSAAEAEVVARFDAAEPAPESWRGDDGLRDALAEALRLNENPPIWPRGYERQLDQILALPEVATLRAKAAAADRVRDALNSHRGCDVETIARALNGPASC